VKAAWPTKAMPPMYKTKRSSQQRSLHLLFATGPRDIKSVVDSMISNQMSDSSIEQDFTRERFVNLFLYYRALALVNPVKECFRVRNSCQEKT
jgi:hypothetical protein